MRSKNLGELLEQGEDSNALISHANFILDLRKALAKVLPGELARHCSIANYRNGKLVVFADNNAIAAKLRLLATGLPVKLSGLLQQTGKQVTAVAIEVQPRSRGPEAATKAVTLSPASADILRTFSSQVNDIKLKSILESLASRGRK